jgi:nucleoside-diphosphate-sugar epimerase
VYGPGDRAFLRLFTWARRGVLPYTGRADAAYTFVYIADLLRVITAVIDQGPANETLFVGHADPITLRELADGIRAAVNPRARALPIPMPVLRVVAVALDVVGAVSGRAQPLDRWRYREVAAEGFVCRVERVVERFGVSADTSLDTGLRQTADWYRREGWL